MAQYAIHAEVLYENMIPAVYPQFCSQPAVHYREILWTCITMFIGFYNNKKLWQATPSLFRHSDIKI